MSAFPEKYNQIQKEGIELYPFLWNENAYKWEDLVRLFESADFLFLKQELKNLAASDSYLKEGNLLFLIESLAANGKFLFEEREQLLEMLKRSREIQNGASRIDVIFTLGERSPEYFRTELERIEECYPLGREGLLGLAKIFSELWSEELFLRAYKLYFSVGVFHFDSFKQSEYFFALSKEIKLQFIREIASILPNAINDGMATNFLSMSEVSASKFFNNLGNEEECLFDLLDALVDSYFKNHMPYVLRDAIKGWVIVEICRRLTKDKDATYFLKLFHKIAASEDADMLYSDWVRDIFQRLITKAEIERFIEMEKTLLSKSISNYSLYLYQLIEARKNKGYRGLLQEFRKWLPKEIAQMKRKQAENFKHHRNQLKQKERQEKSEIKKGFFYYKKGVLRNGFFLLQEFEHNEAFFSESQREELRVVVRDLFEKEEFDPRNFEFVRVDENHHRTHSAITTGSFERALKAAEKLWVNLAGYRERLVALIPFAYSEALAIILKNLKSLSLSELQYLAEIYSQESDLALHLSGNFPQAALESTESLMWVPSAEFELIRDSLARYLDRSDVPAWTKEQTIKLFKVVWVDSSFFKTLFTKHLNPDYNFFRDCLSGNIPEDSMSDFRIAMLANAILIERQDVEAVNWRIDQLKNGAIEFESGRQDMISGVIRVYSPTAQEDEFEHEQAFLQPFWKLEGDVWWGLCFRELLQFALGLEEPYAGYARYVQNWVAMYLKSSWALQGNLTLFQDVVTILDASKTRLAESFRINHFFELKRIAGEITNPQDEERFDLKNKLSHSEDKNRELELQIRTLHEQISIIQNQEVPIVTPENRIHLLVEGVTEFKILNSLIDKKILSRFPLLENRVIVIPCGWASWVVHSLDGHILGKLPGISIGLLDFDYDWWKFWFTGTTKNPSVNWKDSKQKKWTPRQWLYKIHKEDKRRALALLPISNKNIEHQVLVPLSYEESEKDTYEEYAVYTLEHMFYGIEYDWVMIDESFKIPPTKWGKIFQKKNRPGWYIIATTTTSAKNDFQDYVCDVIQRDPSAITIFSPLVAIFSMLETIVKEIEAPPIADSV